MLSKCKILESDPLCLRATGAGISEIDILSPQQAQALDLFVSYNAIERIPTIGQFRSLQRLMISYNKIARIEDLIPLAGLTMLRDLNLEGNPVCRLPLFGIHVMVLLPKLEKLNGKRYKEYYGGNMSIKKANEVVQEETMLLKYITNVSLVMKAMESEPMRTINESIDELYQEYLPDDAVSQLVHAIRVEAMGFPVKKYFAYLRELLINKHNELNGLAEKDGKHSDLVERHKEAINKNDFDLLNETIIAMIKNDSNKEKIIQPKKRKLSAGFGRNSRVGSRLTNRSRSQRDAESRVSALDDREVEESMTSEHNPGVIEENTVSQSALEQLHDISVHTGPSDLHPIQEELNVSQEEDKELQTEEEMSSLQALQETDIDNTEDMNFVQEIDVDKTEDMSPLRDESACDVCQTEEVSSVKEEVTVTQDEEKLMKYTFSTREQSLKIKDLIQRHKLMRRIENQSAVNAAARKRLVQMNKEIALSEQSVYE